MNLFYYTQEYDKLAPHCYIINLDHVVMCDHDSELSYLELTFPNSGGHRITDKDIIEQLLDRLSQLSTKPPDLGKEDTT